MLFLGRVTIAYSWELSRSYIQNRRKHANTGRNFDIDCISGKQVYGDRSNVARGYCTFADVIHFAEADE